MMMRANRRTWLLAAAGVFLFPVAAAQTVELKADSAAGASGPLPKVLHLGAVAPDVLCLHAQEYEVEYGSQTKYAAQPGDEIVVEQQDDDGTVRRRALRRGGKRVGVIAGPEHDLHLWRLSRRIGVPLKADLVPRPASYALRDAAGRTVQPTAVHIKRRPFANPANGFLREYFIFLVLPKPLQPGEQYTLETIGLNFDRTTLPFTFDPRTLRSEAVHVNQIGFRPDDPAKVGYLSIWMGTGGPYTHFAEGAGFSLVSRSDGRVVHKGTTRLTLAHDKDSFGKHGEGRNFPKTDVYVCDFSDFSAPGEYVLSVDGVGCSYPFRIAPDVWEEATRASLRGFFHQRSGIAWAPPYADWERPRDFHPDDGHVFHALSVSRLDYGKMGGDGALHSLPEFKTDTVVENCWGGYHDAGDYDRHTGHLVCSRNMMELLELFPAPYRALELPIPENVNDLPDILDEALWAIDLYRRTQRPDGAVYSGVETNGHPNQGEASNLDTLQKFLYAPDVRSTWQYAASAAQAAWVLRREGAADKSAEYETSALRAMRWAEKEFLTDRSRYETEYGGWWSIKDERNLAAVYLYRLTGDARWHDVFLETCGYKDATKPTVFLHGSHKQDEAALVYVRLEERETRDDVRAKAVAALRAHADLQIEYARNQAFHWTATDWGMPLILSTLAAPQGTVICRAYSATGDPKYLEWAVRTSQWSLGANPMNMTYTTRLGSRSPRFPLYLDQAYMAQPEPPTGYTVYGVTDLKFIMQDWIARWVLNDDFLTPGWKEWPVAESYFDVFKVAMICENTVQQSMAPAVYVWGFLNAR